MGKYLKVRCDWELLAPIIIKLICVPDRILEGLSRKFNIYDYHLENSMLPFALGQKSL